SISRRAAEMLAANPQLVGMIGKLEDGLPDHDYSKLLLDSVRKHTDFRDSIGSLRREWAWLMFEVITFDVFERISVAECKRVQTRLAKASMEVAIFLTRRELERRYNIKIDHLPLVVLGLGKLGGGGIDYDSDLDLVMVYDAESPPFLSEPGAVAIVE